MPCSRGRDSKGILRRFGCSVSHFNAETRKYGELRSNLGFLFFCHKEIVIRQMRRPSLTEEFLFSYKENFYLFLFCFNTLTRPESYRIKCKIFKYPRSSLILFCKTICVVMKITVGHSLEFSPPCSSQMKLEIKRE